MTDIKSMNLTEMAAYFKELGEPAFRAKQVFQWLHRGVFSFDEMTNLSKPLREKLAAARDAGAELVIIGRPEETGDDLEDVLAWLLETGRQKEERAWK